MLVQMIRPILIGLVIGAVTILLVLMALSAVATYCDIPSAVILPLATVANALGAFTGGFSGAKINKKNGWLFGILTAFFLFLFSVAAGASLFATTDTAYMLIKALIMLACGMVGGIFAVNPGKRR